MTLDLNEILSLAPDLLNFIIPGYIFLCIFKKITCIQVESTPQWIWSVVISYSTIALAETVIALFDRYFRFWELVFWCIVIDATFSIILALIWNSRRFQNFIKSKIGVTLYDGALQNAIDWQEASYVCVYLNSTDSYFSGNIVMIDETPNGHITFSAPVQYDANHNVISSNENDINVVMAVPLSDVKRIKIINKKSYWTAALRLYV